MPYRDKTSLERWDTRYCRKVRRWNGTMVAEKCFTFARKQFLSEAFWRVRREPAF